MFARTRLGRNAEQCSIDDGKAYTYGSNHRKIEPESESYVVSMRALAAMALFLKGTQWIVDEALVDTSRNILTPVGLTLLPAVRVPNMRNQEPHIQKNVMNIIGIEKFIHTLGCVFFIPILESWSAKSI